MEIILREDYPALGYVGDRLSVKGGYARNFLIPQGIAVEANARNAKLLAHRVAGINAKKLKLKAQAQEISTRLEALNLEFALKLGERGRSFGSIGPRDIEQALTKEGFQLDRRQIRIPEPIKKGGEHVVLIKLHSEVTSTLKIKVHAEVVASPDAGAKKGGKRRKRNEAEEGTESETESAPADVEAAGEEDIES